MKVSLIAAVADNGVIGREGGLPWDIPQDRRRFRELTMGHTLVMGRKTFESIGRPLEGRRTIVLSRDPSFRHPGCRAVPSLAEALDLCRDESEVFVAGGGEVFAEALPLAHRIYLTRVHAGYQGDVFFPDIPPEEFREVLREPLPAAVPCTFLILERQG